ncbi:uncharacterized protein LOC131610936 [Vicia villosa]|uniref:uncharacterized protein LOC131610936 n=1 Tax=Vicia villosa TaxID=3911 RepID=UPI00273AE3BC|nr:uncharacterized protein LOC131610936 [Vicia villosa]
MEGKWDDVIEKYQEDSNYHNILLERRGTALHVAINSWRNDVLKSLVEAILEFGDQSSLKIVNDRGATPLHLAAQIGYTNACEIIIGKEGQRKPLVQVKDENGETPLFWAVRARHISVFVYLRQFYPLDLNIAIDKHNTSILHVAISKEMFDWAIIIICYYRGLISMNDKNGNTPLGILATKTSAFKSECRLSWWKQILYYCIPISLYDGKNEMELHLKNAISEEERKSGPIVRFGDAEMIVDMESLENTNRIQLSNTQLCIGNLKLVFIWPFMSLLDLHAIKAIKKKHIYGRWILDEYMKSVTLEYMGGGDNPTGYIEYHGIMEDNFLNFYEFIKRARDEGSASMQETKEYKEMEILGNIDVTNTTFFAAKKISTEEIMEVLNSNIQITFDKKDMLLVAQKNNKKESSEEESSAKNPPFLIASSFGIVEMMAFLLFSISSVVFETNTKNENALLLAVKNRKPRVVRWMVKVFNKEAFDILSLQVNNNGDTMLHLAAYTSFERKNTWKISGAVMQMTLEIKWYEYIKNLVPEHFNILANKKGKIPSEIFEEQHTELLKENVDWLKNTTESYSVVAALIAGVAFATSGSVPGGNQPTGEPALKGQHGFEVFAITSLIGLYFSVSALIMFLSILTSRKEVEQFRLNLPMKLLFGLSSLFVSIVSMFVSFCAGHFFVLTDKYTNEGVLFYLYISICLPVIFFAAVQFHLIVDLFKIILIKSPPEPIKGFLQ